jgi:hypothetical protein
MKKLTDSKYLLLSFNLLIKAAEEYNHDNFEGWIRLKSIFNLRLNRLSIKYFSRENFDSAQKLNRLLSLSLLLRAQYAIRAKIFYNFPKIKSKKIRVILCLVLTYFNVFHSLIKSFLSLAFLYEFFPKEETHKKIILTIGFPSYGFNYHSKYSHSNISSFGEYLHDYVSKNNKVRIISVNEYVRKSKRNEQHAIDKKPTPSILQNKRCFVKKKFSLSFLFCNLFKSITLWKSQNRTFSIINITEYLSELQLIPYLDLIEKISQYNQIEKIFILPFTALEFFRKHPSVQDKVFVFYYSENYLIPPVSQSQNKAYKFSDLNISVLGGYCKVFGLTGNINYLYDFVSNSYGIKKENFQTTHDFPCVIGYESLFRSNASNKKFTIALFDVPAETVEIQLARSMIGDMTANNDFVYEYLNDIITLSKKWELKILFKPKYSLSNTNYNVNYRKILNRFVDLYPHNFEISDPYARLADIISCSDLVISFPYTSTYRFSLHWGKPSFFYIPTKFANIFLNGGCRSDCLYGSSEVEKILMGLEVKTRGVSL